MMIYNTTRTGLDVADLSGSGPDVSHVVTDGLRSGHGAGELACLDDRRSTLLNRLRKRNGIIYNQDEKLEKLP